MAKSTHGHRERTRLWILTHPDAVAVQRQIAHWRRRGRLMLIMQEIGGCCVDCGKDNPILLDFDHVDPMQKLRRVSARVTLARMRNEAAKCVLRCANCHRWKTWIKNDTRTGRERVASGA